MDHDTTPVCHPASHLRPDDLGYAVRNERALRLAQARLSPLAYALLALIEAMGGDVVTSVRDLALMLGRRSSGKICPALTQLEAGGFISRTLVEGRLRLITVGDQPAPAITVGDHTDPSTLGDHPSSSTAPQRAKGRRVPPITHSDRAVSVIESESRSESLARSERTSCESEQPANPDRAAIEREMMEAGVNVSVRRAVFSRRPDLTLADWHTWLADWRRTPRVRNPVLLLACRLRTGDAPTDRLVAPSAPNAPAPATTTPAEKPSVLGIYTADVPIQVRSRYIQRFERHAGDLSAQRAVLAEFAAECAAYREAV